MPAKTVHIGVWEALLPFALTLVQAAIVVAVVFGFIPWPAGLVLWILMLVAFGAFSWIRAARQKATLQSGEWIALEYPRGFPGDRAFSLFMVGSMLALLIVLIIATIAEVLAE